MSFLAPAERKDDKPERALLVHIHYGGDQPDLPELEALTVSAGAVVAGSVVGRRRIPDPGTFVGKGKLEEIAREAAALEAGLVIFNHVLTPAQERNLERELQRRVLDRNRLILDIFAQRARSFEGKLQVELAQLQYLSTRLVRGWTHLERQRGGIGLRGPGETQLETDRRLVSARIRYIRKRLERVNQQRSVGGRARRRAGLPLIALAGYTNAGKSTLFNALTEAGVYCADQLFATLDTTSRRVSLAPNQHAILADTVGFIRALPHDLIAAFRATLQETRDADLLLHVADAADVMRDENILEVNRTLVEIGAGERPQLLVYNKIDAAKQRPRVERDETGRPQRIWVSARTGEGLDLLREALIEIVAGETVRCQFKLPAAAARTRARLFALGAVREERIDADGNFELDVELPRSKLERLSREEPALGIIDGCR